MKFKLQDFLKESPNEFVEQFLNFILEDFQEKSLEKVLMYSMKQLWKEPMEGSLKKHLE